MATVNYISYARQSGAALSRVVDYVSQEKKTYDETTHRKLISGIRCTPQLAVREFNMTRQSFHKESPVWFYHYTQSFSPRENISPVEAHSLACEFAKKAWPESEVLIVTHQDAAHIHSHFIINAVCDKTGKMLRQSPTTLRSLRKISDELCREHGLSVLEQAKEQSDGMSAREYRSAAKGESWKLKLMSTIDKCMARSSSEETFKALMEEKGYQMIWEPGRKYITYVTPGGRKCRDNKLHEEKYGKENIIHELQFRQQLIHSRTETLERQGSGGSRRRGMYHDGDSQELDSGTQSAEPIIAADESAGNADGTYHDEGSYGRVSGYPGRRSHGPEGVYGGSAGTVQATGWEYQRKALQRYEGNGQEDPERTLGYEAGSQQPYILSHGYTGQTYETTHQSHRDFGSGPNAVLSLGLTAVAMIGEMEGPKQMPRKIIYHTDRKQIQRLMEKRIALGHRPDDHVDEQDYNLQY